MRPILISLLLASPTIAAEVSATRLDGRSVVGELKSLDEEEAVLEEKDGEERIPVNELLSLRWRSRSQQPATSVTASTVDVELTDGSVLPAIEYRSNASRANITLAGPASSQADTLTLAKRQVAAVRLQQLDARLIEQWNDIRDLEPAADVIVLKQEGQNLDYAEGVLGDVSADKVAFEMDGKAVTVDRKKVAGFFFFRRGDPARVEPRFSIYGRSGLKANGQSVRLSGDLIQLTTAGGTKLDWPLDDIYLADFSAGKLVYLSDLTPATSDATPLIALPSGTSLASKYFEPRRDQSAYGGPLTLASGDDRANLSDAAQQTFQKGLAVRSQTEMVYRLPSDYRRLIAVAGIDPATRASGNVRLEILGDDRSLFSADVKGTDAPLTIDLDIAGVKRLKIVVNYGQNLDTGDWLILGDLRIVK